MYKFFLKRLLDITISGIALIILAPIILIIAILIRIKLGSPVIFKQERPGYKGKIFTMFKFRTMLDPQTRDGKKLTDKERLECIEQGIDILSDEERLPKLGRVLRATSSDELPELWNIFIGDMSIVGPRPLSSIYLPYYTKEEMRRHDMRPGLTGWAQVHGRNSTSWRKRFEYDLYYVDNCSFVLDIKTIIQTIAVVFKQEDIGQGNNRPVAFNAERQK
ncbi:sugar transferase [Merdimonas faecis]|uniref:sugar transferase n=1 Tax=Merdimonas faecis TaxID=1653435 RepID=UPI0023F9839B|nr:sugar transferase [Merdimonas faecis]